MDEEEGEAEGEALGVGIWGPVVSGGVGAGVVGSVVSAGPVWVGGPGGSVGAS